MDHRRDPLDDLVALEPLTSHLSLESGHLRSVPALGGQGGARELVEVDGPLVEALGAALLPRICPTCLDIVAEPIERDD